MVWARVADEWWGGSADGLGRTLPYNGVAEFIPQFPHPYLLLDDTNSRHALWGDALANTKGNIIASFMGNDNKLLNTVEPTYSQDQTCTLSCIDISVAISRIYLIHFYLQTSDDGRTSDHIPIIIISNVTPLKRVILVDS
ncbi:uncharacterized protein [Palaemon carinicauda]|uniref:uncharacterized protein n=1 Tax=Palaemon carinicauda TaxID=392227 RepID=UPI0035B631A2